MTETETAIVVLLSISCTPTRGGSEGRGGRGRGRGGTYFEELSPSASPLASPLPPTPTLALFVVCGTTFGVPVVCTLSTPSVAVTSREVGVSVNCEFTFICESESVTDEDADDDVSDEAAVEPESTGDVGVDTEEEEEIADAEVILDEEVVVLLPTDDGLEEAGDEDGDEEEEAPAPAGGNLSSASLTYLSPSQYSQFPSQRKIINIQIYILWILLDIPTILIGDFQCMFRIC
jgi:hypothetical protein